MSFLGGFIKEKPKSANEVVVKIVSAIGSLGTAVKDKQVERALDDVGRYLNFMKQWLFGDETHEVTKDNAIVMATEACSSNLLSLLVAHLPELEFEARKDVAQIFGAIVRIKDQNDQPIGALHVREHPEILDALVDG